MISGALRQHALVEPDKPIHPFGEPFIVRRNERGGAFTSHKPKEFVKHAIGGFLVEIAGGLIRQHQRGPIGKRAGDRYALLLAARKLRGSVIQSFGET